jgi:hypothetical protein
MMTAATITPTQSGELIVYAREWLLDLKAADADDYDAYVERILGETDDQTRKRISRKYRGGWSAFTREHRGQCSKV